VLLGALAKLKEPFDLYVDVINAKPSGHLIDQWEDLCAPLRSSSTRCVLATHGEVLTPAFGVLKKNQSWKDQTKSWIAVDDAVAAIEHCILCDTIDGHMDLTASHAGGETNSSKKITDSGYEFRYPTLNAALKHVLGA
jgi:NAD dependent epimerase/dehydratase family enzyme